jgi:hypothetical protein
VPYLVAKLAGQVCEAGEDWGHVDGGLNGDKVALLVL